jgi:hypothetical protein
MPRIQINRPLVLDDNFYTNRAWAEVSGTEVHELRVMEVELSNMNYCIFVTED